MSAPFPILTLARIYFQKAKSSGIEFFRFLEEPKVEVLTEMSTASFISSEPLIEARDLSFSYESSRQPVIQKLSFSLREGEWLGIEGQVASGKSTLFYLSFDDLSGYIDNSTIKINDLSFSGRNCVQLNEAEAQRIIPYKKHRLKGLSTAEWELLWA